MSELSSPAVPERPALAPWYRIVRDEGRVLFEHGGSVVTLEGRAADVLLPQLLPLLDGTRSVPEIVGKLGRAAEPSVTNALATLAENGLLTEGTPPPRSSSPRRAASAMFVAAATRRTSPTKADSALASAQVTIAGESPIAGEAARLLSASGVRDVRRVQLDDIGADDEFVVCAPAPGETAGLTTVNASRLAAGRAWLAVMPHDGRSLVVGPLYLPGQSACHACYRLRRASASGYEEDFELVDVEPIRAACPEALSAVAAGLAVTITLRWLAASDASLPGRCYALEAGVVLGLSLHHVLRVPRCPACGPGDTSMPSPWFKETSRDD